MDNTSIADRMKENYEKRSRSYLTRRTPVIMRIDGKAFHTFTKGMTRPFDTDLNILMRATAKKLCEEIQGAVCAYTQSDEISILITDYQNLNSEAWFNYSVQKMTSISASIATAQFNMLYQRSHEFVYNKHPKNMALFDSRVFNIPSQEVGNYFISRQQDWIRNSVQMVGQSYFSFKELQGKNNHRVLEMLLNRGIDWKDYANKWKLGNLCVKDENGWDFMDHCPDFVDIGGHLFESTFTYVPKS